MTDHDDTDIIAQGLLRQYTRVPHTTQWRRWVAAPALWLLREATVVCSWGLDTADRAWHRLRLWREGKLVAEKRHPPYALEVTALPGGEMRDYSRPLQPNEGWNTEGDPLAGYAEDLPGNSL